MTFTPEIIVFLFVVVVIRFAWPLAQSIVELLIEIEKEAKQYTVVRKDSTLTHEDVLR